MNQNDAHALPEPERKFEAKNNKEYNVKLIIDSTVYSKEIDN